MSIRWKPTDGSIPHLLCIAHGDRAYEDYYVFDLTGETFGDAAELMRGFLKPGAKTVRVAFPNGTSRTYTTYTGARQAVIRAERTASGLRTRP